MKKLNPLLLGVLSFVTSRQSKQVDKPNIVVNLQADDAS